MSYYFWLGAEAEELSLIIGPILAVEEMRRTLAEHYGHDD